ncbi:MAG: class I SAM-dependent methyltransferase [Proteobacteria bacterium]|nr:class I SAM-dependent methyltransferase [Pseudomonadota bacterium]
MQTTGPGPDSPPTAISANHRSIRGGVIQEISASTGAKSRKGCGGVERNLMIDGTTNSAVCPACKAQSMLIGTKNDYQIFECGNCSFLFVHPYPIPDELTGYYSSNYRGASANYYPKLKSRKRRALVKSLRFFRYVYRKKVLDIGCGGGVMVNAFRRLGADAHGADISWNSIQFARQKFPRCTFYCENFDVMRRRHIRFDFMFTSELMEHVAGPHECLRMIDALSKPGTVVYVATPDAGHAAVPEDIFAWEDLCPPEHLQWFNQSNLAKVFDAYGFDLLKAYHKKTPALSLLFRKRGE